jgi:hypothetical protein
MKIFAASSSALTTGNVICDFHGSSGKPVNSLIGQRLWSVSPRSSRRGSGASSPMPTMTSFGASLGTNWMKP